LLLAVLVTDATANIVFGVCYVKGREIERTGKPGDTVWVEQAMVHTLISDMISDKIIDWLRVNVSVEPNNTIAQ
jgi:hypothetical protein